MTASVTNILSAIENGEPGAADRLLPLVYTELRRLAATNLAVEQPGNTLQPTALVHEAYIRLVGSPADEGDCETKQWSSRVHFFNAAAQAMRRILVDAARKRKSQKRGGHLERQEFDLVEPLVYEQDEELLAVSEALDRFALEDPEKAALVKLRYFAGLTMPETALALGISIATAERHWRVARAKLVRYVREDNGEF